MVTYVQLELFDLQAYTNQQSPKDCCKVIQIEQKPKTIGYKQLELDLFPEQPDEGVNLKQAA